MGNKGIFIFMLMCLCVNISSAREYELKDYLSVDNPDRKAYIKRFYKIAMEEMRRSGVPASIKLAQGILESGDGKSSLAREAKNHFGMKCGSNWTGGTYYLKDDDFDKNGNLIKSCFRVFNNADESYVAHSAFLRNPKKDFRYGFLFDLDIRDYKAWAKGLKKAGYATNKRYPELLIGIIEANQLYKYDVENYQPSLEADPLAGANPSSVPSDNTGNNIPSELDDFSRHQVFYHNKLRVAVAGKNDTPFTIAKRFNVNVRKVLRYNDTAFTKNKLKEGDKVYLQSKRKKWKGKQRTHNVKPGETMYSISQKYGIRLDRLYKINRMEKGTQPAYGMNISIKKKINKKKKIKLRKDEPTVVLPPPVAEPKPEPSVPAESIPVPTTKPQVPVATNPIPATPIPQQPEVEEPSTNEPVIISTPESTPPAKQYHTVVKGDTLYSISRRFSISVSDLKLLNGLSNNIISIGQVLRVR